MRRGACSSCSMPSMRRTTSRRSTATPTSTRRFWPRPRADDRPRGRPGSGHDGVRRRRPRGRWRRFARRVRRDPDRRVGRAPGAAARDLRRDRGGHRPGPPGRRRGRGDLLRTEREDDGRPRPRPRRDPARGLAPRAAGDRVLAGRGQERHRRDRPRDEGAGPVHGPASAPAEDAAAADGRGGRRGRRVDALLRGRAPDGGRAAPFQRGGPRRPSDRGSVMISRIRGVLLRRSMESAEVMTPGGVGYEVEIPLTVYERLPPEGEEVEFITYYL